MISKPFAFHKPSEESLNRITNLRRGFSEIEELLRLCCPQSRELSVALTNLETSAMWAIKSVVSNDTTSEAQVEK